MQSKHELHEGKSRLEALLREFPPDSQHWNEAQNRFQFIDRLLIEVLGWEHPNISVEKSAESIGRSDYVLGSPGRAILEAKREATIFDIPPGTKPSQVKILRSLTTACKNVNQAVEQVISYCAMTGVQIAVICNGPQLILFQAVIPGQSPLDGEAYIFNGFSDYVSFFSLLWKLLSPEGIFENKALRNLAEHRNPRIPSKADNYIKDAKGFRYRNDFQEKLRALGSILLSDIDTNREVKSQFYKECYVPLEANNRHLLLSKKIIASRYNRVSDNGIIPANISTTISRGKLNLVAEGELEQLSARPIVVIGDVGVGKTSFFENLFEKLDENDKAQTYYMHINLGDKATLTKDIKTYVLAEIPHILLEKYEVSITSKDFVEKLYEKDLLEFDRGIYGDLKDIDNISYEKEKINFLKEKLSLSDQHLQKSLTYLYKAKNKQIVIVIDNADQRKFEVQQEAFLIAQELASNGDILVFVALRPSTFYQSKLKGALSGYQNKLLTISPPPADEVIRKRITFAVRVAEGRAKFPILQGIEIDFSDIITFLKVMLRSINNNNKIKMFIGNITGGNIRLLVELISGFCGSPNVDAERIVTIEKERNEYQIPLHEFTKHALLGEYQYYNSESSLVACNVYDVSATDPREHFLACLIISYIHSPMGKKDNDGFVHGDDIVSEMQRNGFTVEQVQFSLRKLATKRLIETPYGHYREVDVSDEIAPSSLVFRATSIGLYHIRFWIADFAFLDAMAIDTPIFNAKFRQQVFDLAQSHEISDRYNKSKLFLEYLEEQWRLANFSATYFNFSEIVSSNSEGFRSVAGFIQSGPKIAWRRRRKQ